MPSTRNIVFISCLVSFITSVLVTVPILFVVFYFAPLVALQPSKAALPSKQIAEVLVVPPLVGLSLLAAQKHVRALGLEIKVSRSVPSEQEKGMILSQFPQEGKSLLKGHPILVSLSLGKPLPEKKVVSLFSVPNAVGLVSKKAKDLILRSGFEVDKVVYGFQKGVKDGIIINQFPKAGEKAIKGSKVKLVMNRE